MNLFDIPLTRIDGAPASLAAHRSKVLLLVNVASKCGLTPQYAGLEALYREKRAQGLEVLGFPANNFLGQEPGTEEEIATFCSSSYDVTFPLFSKISVVGVDKHPLYRELTQAAPQATGEGPMRQRLQGYGIATSPPGEVLWNFEKFLVGRDGRILGRFAPDVEASDPRLRSAIDAALAASA
ncbi:glutathione peroxidase [Aggregicoccus sp. 17bor-14]|uniref:glutathione peroxidase n=1 Tax=Myxococcaceae TaxID=31 RepID=UPI00129C420A|nr:MULTISPECIES: glutathione peroxidase [Myxococcaceae]MBF5044626.1 glutathione peroxidase [Simulacricoccus sp. 17bor-14]MRI90370.1 glutathione peroxidase [Aggregicoccus sp. 17bor-14]